MLTYILVSWACPRIFFNIWNIFSSSWFLLLLKFEVKTCECTYLRQYQWLVLQILSFGHCNKLFYIYITFCIIKYANLCQNWCLVELKSICMSCMTCAYQIMICVVGLVLNLWILLFCRICTDGQVQIYHDSRTSW